MQAQAYLASTPTGRELTPDERIKTIRGVGYMYAPPLEEVE